MAAAAIAVGTWATVSPTPLDYPPVQVSRTAMMLRWDPEASAFEVIDSTLATTPAGAAAATEAPDVHGLGFRSIVAGEDAIGDTIRIAIHIAPDVRDRVTDDIAQSWADAIASHLGAPLGSVAWQDHGGDGQYPIPLPDHFHDRDTAMQAAGSGPTDGTQLFGHRLRVLKFRISGVCVWVLVIALSVVVLEFTDNAGGLFPRRRAKPAGAEEAAA